MEKLSKFAQNSNQIVNSDQPDEMADLNKNLDIFKLFKKYTDKIIEGQEKKLEIVKLLELETAFMNFSIKTYPSNIDYVN